MSNLLRLFVSLMALGSASLAQAAAPAAPSAKLHRGDFVRVRLMSGPVYHLKLSGLDEATLVGLSGNMSVHLPRHEIASVEREAAPRETMSGPTPTTAVLGLLGLSAASNGAAQNFGAGHACNGSTSGC